MKFKAKLQFGIGILFVIIVWAIVGSSWLSQEPTGPLEKVTIAEGTQPIAGLIYIAYMKGYFINEGLNVTLKSYNSGKACLNSLIEGNTNFGTVSETPIMHAGMTGEKIYILSTIHNSEKNTVVTARKDKGISTPGNLKGKKIGVSVGTNGEFFLDMFLTIHGILKNKIEVVNLKPEKMFDALVKGEVDAISTWNPHAIRLQKKLGNGGITFYGEGVYTETYNIVAMQDFVSKNPETIKKVLRALIKAERFIRENPDESLNIIADYIKMDKTLLNELWNIYNFTVSIDQSLLATLENQARWAIKNKYANKTKVSNYLNFIYLDGMEEVKPGAITIIR